MKKIILIIIIFALGVAVWFVILGGKETSDTPEGAQTETTPIRQTTSMQITSSVFLHEGSIPPKYTCDGENISPPLEVSGVPDGTRSLALISDDPDAPAGSWVHWTVWNISPATAEIPENFVPDGAGKGIALSAIEGKTSFGSVGYGGPCPPSGTHRYFFKLYALDTILALDSSATKEDLLAAIEGHILAEAELMGVYARK